MEAAAKAVEDAKIAKKEAAKAAAKAKAKAKAYDQSRLTTLEPQLKGWGLDLREKCKKMFKKATQLILTVKNDSGLVENFKQGLAVLELRTACLEKVMGQPEQSGVEARAAFNEWLNTDEVKAAMHAGCKTQEPHPKITEMKLLNEVEGSLATFAPTSMTQETEQKKSLKKLVDEVGTMISRVGEQVNRLGGATKRFDDKLDNKVKQ